MKKWKTVIMSDLHLGSRQSQTDKILKFLEENEMEKEASILHKIFIKLSRLNKINKR